MRLGYNYIVLKNLNAYQKFSRIEGFDLSDVLKIVPLLLISIYFIGIRKRMKKDLSFPLWIYDKDHINIQDSTFDSLYSHKSKTLISCKNNKDHVIVITLSFSLIQSITTVTGVVAIVP